jgi:cysteine desulfurase
VKRDAVDRPVYLDYHATTPVDERVLQAMLPYFTEHFGNATSDHRYGAEAHEAVERARSQVAATLGADPTEIVFTSGATESINLALIGAAEASEARGGHIVTSAIEHPAVLDTCRHLESRGWEVTFLPVDDDGLHSAAQVASALRSETVIVSIMTANNEIGAIQPISEIASVAHEHGALFHTDATQALSYLPLDVRKAGIDLLSCSSHKVYGPKGVGALFVRRSFPRVRLRRLAHGGGHERGLRSGTFNVPGIVGFGAAAELSNKVRREESERVRVLRDELYSLLAAGLEGVMLNGHPSRRLPNNLNISIEGVESRSVLTLVSDRVALSTGSACSTGKVEPSHVVMSLPGGEARAHSALRMAVGRFTTADEVRSAASTLISTFAALRRIAL